MSTFEKELNDVGRPSSWDTECDLFTEVHVASFTTDM